MQNKHSFSNIPPYFTKQKVIQPLLRLFLTLNFRINKGDNLSDIPDSDFWVGIREGNQRFGWGESVFQLKNLFQGDLNIINNIEFINGFSER